MKNNYFIVLSVVWVLAMAQHCLAQAGGTYDAPKTTISIDGNLSDWNSPLHGVLSHSHNNGKGDAVPLQMDIKYAWDDNNLYVLVAESAPDDDPAEGPNAAEWAPFPNTGAQPWNTDGVGFFDVPESIACCSGPAPPGTGQTGPKTQFWAGLTGLDVADFDSPDQRRLMDREIPEDNDGVRLVPSEQSANVDPAANGGLRAIEFRVGWDEIRYTTASGFAVPGHSREDVGVGYNFRLDPLAVDGENASTWNKQQFPGGSTTPAGVTMEDTSFVQLVVPEPSTLLLIALGIFGLVSFGWLRRR